MYNALRRLEWQTNREVDKAVHNLMASSNKGGVDSTQFKAKKTVFRESHKSGSEGGQQVQAVMAGWKCSTYQYLGSMQMKVCVVCVLCVCWGERKREREKSQE